MALPGSRGAVALLKVSISRERLEAGEVAPEAVEVVGTAGPAGPSFWEPAARVLWEMMAKEAAAQLAEDG